MLAKSGIQQRLDAINLRIEETRLDLVRQDRLTDGHDLMSGELLVRYERLRTAILASRQDLEEFLDPLAALEAAVTGWIDRIGT